VRGKRFLRGSRGRRSRVPISETFVGSKLLCLSRSLRSLGETQGKGEGIRVGKAKTRMKGDQKSSQLLKWPSSFVDLTINDKSGYQPIDCLNELEEEADRRTGGTRLPARGFLEVKKASELKSRDQWIEKEVSYICFSF